MNPIQALSAQPTSLPGPPWMLLSLLYLLFTCHLVFMNLTAGGNLLEAVFLVKGKSKHLDAAEQLARLLPYSTAMAILFGVASLLFTQVLYGRLFYTSAILLGAPFILIIPALITAYALMYLQAARWHTMGRKRVWTALGVFLLLGYIGFVWSNLSAMMLEPERFAAKYLSHPDGIQFDLADPSLLPRLYHAFLASIAVAGLYVAIMGTRRLKLHPEQGRWQYRSGATWFAGATLVNLFVGPWRFFNLDQAQRTIITGGSALATALFITGIASALAAFVFALLGLNSLKPKPRLYAAAAFVVVTIFCMSAVRDAVRRVAVGSVYRVEELPVHSQWPAVSIFFLLLIVAIATSILLLRLLLENPSGKSLEPAGPGLTDSGVRKLGGSGGDLESAEADPGQNKPSEH